MKAKFVFENVKGNLPNNEDELKKIFNDEVNSALWVSIKDDGTIVYATYPGSSLRNEIMRLFKRREWDKHYNVKNIEFDDHTYTIHPYGSEVDRITPTFDPEADVPEGQVAEEEFVEDFIEQASDDPDMWMELAHEYVEEAIADDEMVFVVEERISNFFPLYSGEFLQDVYSERHEYIIKSIADNITDMFG